MEAPAAGIGAMVISRCNAAQYYDPRIPATLPRGFHEYASDLAFVGGGRNAAPRGSGQSQDRDLTEFCKALISKAKQKSRRGVAGSACGATFLRRLRDFAAIFGGLHEDSVMHCIKQEGDPGV
jgi:streptomycin 6-kinase